MNFLLMNKTPSKTVQVFKTFLLVSIVAIYLPFGITWSWQMVSLSNIQTFEQAFEKVIGFWSLVSYILIIPVFIFQKLVTDLYKNVPTKY